MSYVFRRGACQWKRAEAWTAGHTHGFSETLIVPPGLKHCHGAMATTAMTSIVIQEKLDDKVVEGMEEVSDEQYQGR